MLSCSVGRAARRFCPIFVCSLLASTGIGPANGRRHRSATRHSDFASAILLITPLQEAQPNPRMRKCGLARVCVGQGHCRRHLAWVPTLSWLQNECRIRRKQCRHSKLRPFAPRLPLPFAPFALDRTIARASNAWPQCAHTFGRFRPLGSLAGPVVSGMGLYSASAVLSSARVAPLTAANTLRHNRAQAAESADSFNNGTGTTGGRDDR